MIVSFTSARTLTGGPWAGIPAPLGAVLRVSQLVATGLRLGWQFGLLVGVYYAGSAVVQVTGIPLPGNLVGMLLLLGLLRLGLVRLDQVEDVASLLVKHLNLFFLPLAVGLMAWSGLLGLSGLTLAICLVGSAAVGVVVAGRVSQRLISSGGSVGA